MNNACSLEQVYAAEQACRSVNHDFAKPIALCSEALVSGPTPD